MLPGGRIHSDWFGDTVVELGAACYKSTNDSSSFLQLAVADGFLHPPVTHTSIFTNCDGHSVNSSISTHAYEIFKKIYCEVLEIESDRFDYINFRIEQELNEFSESVQDDAARIIIGLFALVNKKESGNSQFIAREGHLSYLQIPGGKIKIPLGLTGVIQPMLTRIPEDKIKYNKPVQNIQWGAVACKDTPRALIRCFDGSIYPADYVIITVPLGVLKGCHESMFCPALPAETVDALRSLKFEYVNNIYLRFSEPFWTWCNKLIDIKYTCKDRMNQEGWTQGIKQIIQVPGSDNVLFVQLVGNISAAMEKKDIKTIVDGVLCLLRDELMIYHIPPIRNTLRSKWSNNIYFNGAYSFLPDGVSEEVHHKLGSPIPGNHCPVPPILFFAGEATCARINATVQGAKISGIREAMRIKHLITSGACIRHSVSQEKVAVVQ